MPRIKKSTLLSKKTDAEHFNEYVQISIFRTSGEWDIILSKIAEMGKKDFNSFVRAEIRRLIAAYDKCPKCVSNAGGEKILKRPDIPVEHHKKLQALARKMGTPVSSVVDMFVIAPLLKPDY